MARHWARGAKFLVFAIVALAIVGVVVRTLWNWLIPVLFGLPAITYWQALGLLVLSRILIGGWRGRPGPRYGHWRRRMMERWEQMTPEEREQFRRGLHDRWGPFEPAADAKKPI